MRLAASLLAGLLLGLLPSAAGARRCSDGPLCHSLKDVTGVGFLVEALSRPARNIGLSGKGLEDLTLVTLRAKLPRVKVDTSVMSPYIYILVIGGTISAWVQVTLHHFPVRFKPPWGKEEIVLGVDLWSKATLLTGPESTMRRRMRETVEEFLTTFAADWYKANPGK